MSNALIPLEENQLAPYSEKDLAELTGAGEYLPRLQLVASTSALVEKISSGNFAFCRSTDNVDDLGKELHVVVVAMQPKAAIYEKGKVPVSITDMNNPQFANIRNQSNARVPGCVYGPEFLFWIPSKDSFATFHCSNATARKEARNIIDLIGAGATVTRKMCKNDKGNWWGIAVTPNNAPVANLPAQEDVKDAMAKFRGVPTSGGQVMEEAGEASRPM